MRLRNQGSEGIADNLMHIPIYDTQSYLFCRLKLVVKRLSQHDKPTNPNSVKVLKVAKSTNKKTLL